MRFLITFLAPIALLFADTPPKQPTPKSTHSVTKVSPSKSVHVRQYTRKDGTVVHAYNRAAPGTAARSGKSSTSNKGSAKSAKSRSKK